MSIAQDCSDDPKILLRSTLGLGGGPTLYPWQTDLLGRMLKGDVPELIDIPTGLGKTSVIAIWLIARRCGANLPRRLVYCLPMRVLVEQTRSRAVWWAKNLDLLAGEAKFDGNRLVHYAIDWSNPQKVAVVTLMGGEAQDDWREHPEHAAMIIGTQDMLLSRALNRGFAMAPQLWPVDFGFLNVDALWVMDEVQLMGPARTSSVQLQHFWDERKPEYGSRRTIWMSATLGSQPGSLEQPHWMQTPERAGTTLQHPPLTHSEQDLRHPGFAARWTAPKRLELHLDGTAGGRVHSEDRTKTRRRSGGASTPSASAWTVESQELVERIRKEARDGQLVLVFVNQVQRARQLYDRLKEEASGSEARLLHGRMRPRDRRTTEAELNEPVPQGGRVVVATQVLEAGVDIDADALFTELCPWPSLVQRLGRLNRSGTRPSEGEVENGKQPAPAIVFEPLPPVQKKGESSKDYAERRRREAALPYEADALDEARRQLDEIAKHHGGSLSPETLAKLPVSLPMEGPVLRRFDLNDLFDTDPDLSGGHFDVTRFIRAVDRDVDAYVLWRRIEGGLDPEEQVPLHPDELCPVPFYEAQKTFGDNEVWILTLATGRQRGSAWRRARGQDIHAGDTVMVDVKAGGYGEKAGWTGNRDEAPAVIVDRWKKEDGTLFRAWVRVASGLVEEIDDKVVGVRGRGEDPRSFGKHWMELEQHLRKAEEEAKKLAAALGLPGELKSQVVQAGRWHDVGKALERQVNGEMRRPFQEMLRTAGRPENDHPRPDLLYAKSNGRGGQPAGFRHELASLLAFLQSGQAEDLAAFLILAHHGKVRLLPEAWNDEDFEDLCGVREGDRIPRVALPGGTADPLVLDPKILLPSPAGPGWQGRVHRLLQRYGPFLLAYLEGLVRMADWRAS
ncbi:MAG: type I-G CRISPR-associated helicase/endonuclease Cas3g [Halothiobacillaceae bacterium]